MESRVVFGARRAQMKPLVYVIGITAALAGLLFGLDIGVISGALGSIEKEFHATTRQLQDIVSALLWGATIGAIISGYFSKKIGRRRTILLAAVIFVAGSFACSVAPSVPILIGCRLFLGVAVGVASFTAPLYLSEISPQSVRGGMISLYQLMITIGIVLAFLSDTYFASYAQINGVVGGHWRMMLGILVVPATIMFIGVFCLPDSPRWLAMVGRKDEAMDVLNLVRVGREEIQQEMREIDDSLKIKQKGWQLFWQNSNFRRVVFLGLCLQVIQQLTGINVVMYYAPKIFSIAGFETTSEQMWGTVMVGSINVLATFIAIAFVDKLGRKPMMYAGFVVMGLSMVAVALMFAIGVANQPLVAFLAVISLLLFIVGFAFSAGPIVWILCSEIQPIQGRDLGVMVSTATNWIVNGIVGATFLTLLETLGPSGTFLAYGVLEFVFIVFFLLYVPETKGVSLEKIESNLMAGKKLRQIGR